MSATDLSAAILLGVGVAIELLCCLGVLVMTDTFDRLHYLGPASTLGPIAIVAAVLVGGPGLQSEIKVVLIVLTLMLIGPVVTHVTGRAARVRQMGSVEIRDSEKEAA